MPTKDELEAAKALLELKYGLVEPRRNPPRTRHPPKVFKP